MYVYIDFQHEILVEPLSQANLVTPRGFFLHKDKSSTKVSQKSRLSGGSDYCITNELYIRVSYIYFFMLLSLYPDLCNSFT